MRKLGIKFPAVLDEFGNSTEQAYTGWPDRIYLIDSQGRMHSKANPALLDSNLTSWQRHFLGPYRPEQAWRRAKATHGGYWLSFSPGHRRKPVFSRSQR